MNKQKGIQLFLSSIIAAAMMLLIACSNSRILNEALRKQQAAIYYYDQRDHNKTEKYCREAIDLWKVIEGSNFRSISKWAVENNILQCEELIERISKSQTLTASTIVPIRILSNRFFIDAYINQKEKVSLLLDTGATSTVISPNVADSLGISPTDDSPISTVTVFGGEKVKVPYVSLSQVKVGDAVVRNISAGVFQGLPDIPYIDGVLGVDFLNHFTFTIDHSAGELTLAPKSGKPIYEKRLVGEWQGVDRHNNWGRFVFFQDGKADLSMDKIPSIKKIMQGRGALKYSLDISTDPMNLDLIIVDNFQKEMKRMKMILKFISSTEIMIKMSHGEERPKDFIEDDKGQTITLEKMK